MTQQVLHARTTLKSLSPLIDDPSFSTYWEQVGSDTSVNQATVIAKLTAFFNTLPAGNTQKVGQYIHPVISRATNACTIELYDITHHLDGTPAGSPLTIANFTLTTEGGGGAHGIPEAISICVGYRVDYGTDVEFGAGIRPRSRDRNRFYIGPLNMQVLDQETTTNRTIWATIFESDVLRSAGVLLTGGSGSSDITSPVVWSRRNAAVKQPIVAAWTDDRPDYQRRRSDPGIKTTIAI